MHKEQAIKLKPLRHVRAHVYMVYVYCLLVFVNEIHGTHSGARGKGVLSVG